MLLLPLTHSLSHSLIDLLAATMDMNYAIREENILRAFQSFDSNGSGELTLKDLIEVMGSEDHARELVVSGGELSCFCFLACPFPTALTYVN